MNASLRLVGGARPESWKIRKEHPRLRGIRFQENGIGAHQGCVRSGLGSDRTLDRKSTRLNSSHVAISYAVFCLKKKTDNKNAVPAANLITPASIKSTIQSS